MTNETPDLLPPEVKAHVEQLEAASKRLDRILVAADKFTMRALEDFAADASQLTMKAADDALRMQEKIVALRRRIDVAAWLSKANKEVMSVAAVNP